MGGLGYVEGVLMISETTVMMLIAIQFGFMAFVLMKLDMKKGESERLKNDIEKSLASITIPDINFDDLKEELMGMVEDLMQSMRIPTIADHLGGALSAFAQMKMVKMQQNMGMMSEPQISEEQFAESEDF
jgi:hypothetical protein